MKEKIEIENDVSQTGLPLLVAWTMGEGRPVGCLSCLIVYDWLLWTYGSTC